jgi:hypothetical protein
MDAIVFKVSVTPVEDNKQREYVIDGVRAPKLYLKVGKLYHFALQTDDYPFYITTDAIGGTRKLKNICEDVNQCANESGIVKFLPTVDHVKQKIYYQSDTNRLMGNRIMISN